MNSDNPRKQSTTTGEQIAQQIWANALSGASREVQFNAAVNAINAALDATEKAFQVAVKDAAELERQVSAERELREEAEKEATLLRDQWLGEHAELQDQLAAAVEALTQVEYFSESLVARNYEANSPTVIKMVADVHAALAKIGGGK